MADEEDIDALAEMLAADEQEDDFDPGQRGEGKVVHWMPRLNEPTQLAAFNDPNDIVAMWGEKYSGKTITAGHKIVRHCWQEWDALFLILGTSYGALSEGICHDLTSLILPTWAEGNREPLSIWRDGKLVNNPRAGELMDDGMGLEYTGWKLDPNNKNLYLKIQNRFGGWSRIRVISSPHAKEVEARVKGPAPSGVYLEEATNAKGKEYFTYPSLQLYRRRDIVGPQQYLLSFNPEDESNWVYQWLWKEAVVTDGGRVWPNDKVIPGIRRDSSISVYYLPYHENMHNVSQKNREMLDKNLRADPILKARLVDGKWIAYPSGEAIFKNSYAESTHVFGDAEKNRGLLPVKGHPIVLGYDPGTANPSCTFEQIIDTQDGIAQLIIDELVYTNEHVNYYRYTKMLMEKMLYWQRRREYLFEFRFIADDQATTAFNPSKGSTTARDIEDYSRQIKEADPQRYATVPVIRFIGCPKPPGSVEARVNLTTDAQVERRLLVSATCRAHRAMYLHLERDKESPSTPKRSRHIHPFDSSSYPMFFRRYQMKTSFRELGERKAVEIVRG